MPETRGVHFLRREPQPVQENENCLSDTTFRIRLSVAWESDLFLWPEDVLNRARGHKKTLQAPPACRIAVVHLALSRVIGYTQGVSEMPSAIPTREALRETSAQRLGVQEGAEANRFFFVARFHDKSDDQKSCSHYRPFRLEGST